MATYQLGVAQCLLNYAPWKIRSAPFVLGASAGSLVAAAVVCEVSLGELLLFPQINVFCTRFLTQCSVLQSPCGMR